MYYSKITGGFYDLQIHDVIPDDAVEITAECHAGLLAGQSAGEVICPDVYGFPVLVAPPIPDPQIAINTDALAYLAETDWYIIRLQETGEAIPAEVLDKRQAARKAVVR